VFYKIFSDHVKINSLVKQSIKSGDIVNVNVIKQLGQGKWAIGIKGNMFPASSQIGLVPGQTFRAQIFFEDKKLILKLIDRQIAPFELLIKNQGLIQDAISESIVASLFKSNLKIDSEVISRFRKILEKLKRNDQRASRLLASIFDKSINLSDEYLEKMFEILEYSNRQFTKRHKKEAFGDNLNQTKTALKKILSKKDPENTNLLQLFNHLKGNNQNWIVLPFGLTDNESDFDGTVRILYDDNLKKIEKVVLIVNVSDDVRFSFYIESHEKYKSFRVIIFCNDSNYSEKAGKKISELNRKLQNKGIKIDDIIYNDEAFDGFSPSFESSEYKNIDTLL